MQAAAHLSKYRNHRYARYRRFRATPCGNNPSKPYSSVVCDTSLGLSNRTSENELMSVPDQKRQNPGSAVCAVHVQRRDQLAVRVQRPALGALADRRARDFGVLGRVIHCASKITGRLQIDGRSPIRIRRGNQIATVKLHVVRCDRRWLDARDRGRR